MFAEICGFDKTIRESATLSKRVEHHLSTIGTATLTFILTKDRDRLGTISLCEEPRLGFIHHKGRLRF
jgi:hypothetical protein